MTRLDSARAGFDEEWIEDEVVLSVDQINLVRGRSEALLEFFGAVRPAKTSAQYNDSFRTVLFTKLHTTIGASGIP